MWKNTDIHDSESKRNSEELGPECEEALDEFILLIMSFDECTRMTYNKNLSLKEFFNRH